MMYKTPIVLILTVALSAGCATLAHHLRSDCNWAEPIRPARNDVLSDGTLAQIVAHNEIGERLCGWQPSSPVPAGP